MWSALKGASITATLRELIAGNQPTGANVYPIDVVPPTVAQANITAGATNAGDAGITPRANPPRASGKPIPKGSYQRDAMSPLGLKGGPGQWSACNNIEIDQAG